MKTLISKTGVEVVVYSSADELPIKRYAKLQKYLLMEASTEKFMSKLERVKAFLDQNDTESAKAEVGNAILCLNSVFDGVPYSSYAFACLVYKIGDKVALDVSEDGLANTADQMDALDLSHAEIKNYNEEVKKKSRKLFQILIPKKLRHSLTI